MPVACIPAKVSVEEFDLELLVKYRQQHETRQAAEGVHTQTTKSTADHKDSSRRQLIKAIHQVLKAVDTRRVGTGLERDARWTGKGQKGPAPTGNAANVKVVADAASRTVSILPVSSHHHPSTQTNHPGIGTVATSQLLQGGCSPKAWLYQYRTYLSCSTTSNWFIRTILVCRRAPCCSW